MYLIGQVAELTQLPIDTLRYYEKQGLIQVKRNKQNQRIYGEDELVWLAFIKRLKQTGMSVANVQTYASLRYQGEATISKRRELLEEQLKRVKVKQQQLQANHNMLEQKIALYRQQERQLNFGQQ